MKKSKDDFVSFMQKIAKKIRDFSDIESRISNNSSISDRDMFVVVDFIKFFSEKMNLSEVPKISLIPEAGDNHSTGAFNEKSKTIESLVSQNQTSEQVINKLKGDCMILESHNTDLVHSIISTKVMAIVGWIFVLVLLVAFILK
jgi:hypothetical protein